MISLANRLASLRCLLTLAALIASSVNFASSSTPTWPQCAWYATDHDLRLVDTKTGQSTAFTSAISGDVQLAMNNRDCGVWLLDRSMQTLAYYSALGRRDVLIKLSSLPAITAAQSIAMDPHDGSFWLQAKEGLTHFSASGQLQKALPWADPLAQVHIALDGGVWALSGKQLLHWAADGVLHDKVDLGAQLTTAAALTIDSLRDRIWIAGGGRLLALQRFQPGSAAKLSIVIPADVSELTLDPATGDLWGKTEVGAIAVVTGGAPEVQPAIYPVQSSNGNFDFVNADPVSQSYWLSTGGRLLRSSNGQAEPQVIVENTVITGLAFPIYAVLPQISASPAGDAWLNTLNPQWTIHISGTCDSLSCTLPAAYAQAVRLAAKLDGVDISTQLQRSSDGNRYTFTPATPLAEGAHSLVVQAWDRFAQVADPVTASIAIDITPPSLSQLFPADGSVVGQPLVHIQGKTSEPAAVVLVNKQALHAAEPSPQNDTFNWNASLSPGPNTVQLSAIDRAGNVGNTALHITYSPGHTGGASSSGSGNGGAPGSSGGVAGPAAAIVTTSEKAPLNTTDKKLDPSATAKAAAIAKYLHLPLSFELNQGQANTAVRFLTRNSQNSMFFGDHSAAITLHAKHKNAASAAVAGKAVTKAKPTSATVSLELIGANAHPTVSGAEPLPTRSHYFLGNDKSHWLTNVPHYAKVVYHDVYPGIDQIFYGNQGSLEYDFVVAANADPSKIRLLFQGSLPPTLDSNGNLLLSTTLGQMLEQRPNIYQTIHGQKHPLSGQYVLNSDYSVGFSIAAYDHSQPLIIDPVIIFATYLGNIATTANGVTVGSDGGVYVTGTTTADDLPGSVTLTCGPNAAQANVGYVTKLAGDGQSVLYTAYFGSNDGTITTPTSVAVDSSGAAYVAGNTYSRTFPESTGAVQGALGSQIASGSGWSAGFALKLSADGSGLQFATYFGGTYGSTYNYNFGSTVYNDNYTRVNSIAVDGSGNIYLVGDTSAHDIPVTSGSLLTTKPAATGRNTGFVAKLNPTATTIVYASYLGGTLASPTLDDSARVVAVDAAGDAYVGGLAASSNFPTTAGAFQTSVKGASDGYVLEINPSGNALTYSTLLGGGTGGTATGYTAAEAVNALTLDTNGNVYVTGFTNSKDFPLVNPYQSHLLAAEAFTLGNQSFYFTNAFVAKILAGGQALGFSTYLGGDNRGPISGQYLSNTVYLQDVGNAIALDASGNVTVAGIADSNNFPMLSNGASLAFDATEVAFVGQFDPSGQLRYSIPLSGDNSQSTALALDGTGDAYVVGATANGVLQATKALQGNTTGSGNVAFVTKVGVNANTVTTLIATPNNVATPDQVITLSATVSDPSATGTIAFTGGTWSLGIVELTNGSASVSTTGYNMGLGNHALVAQYSGDVLHAASQSPVMSYVVANPIWPTVSVLPGNSVAVGQLVILNVALPDPTATGTFTFTDGNSPIGSLGSVALTNGAASFSTTSLAAGIHYIRVDYSGDVAHPPSYLYPVNVTVAAGPPTVAIIGPTTGSSYFAPANVTLVVRASSTMGTLQTLTLYDGSTLLSTYTVATPVNGLTYNFTINGLAVGSHSMTAVATDSGGGSTTSAPVVLTVVGAAALSAVITQPTPNINIPATTLFPIAVTVGSPTANIQSIQVNDGAVSIGSYTLPTPLALLNYTFSVRSASPGLHSYTVVVTDAQGNTATSMPLAVNITAPPAVPAVQMTYPFNQSYLVLPALAVLNANTSSPNGTVTQVQFFANGVSLGVVTASPFQLPWRPAAVGAYTLTATVTDSTGATATSAPISVTVLSNPSFTIATPLSGAVINDDMVTVTGTIQAPPNSGLNINGKLAVIAPDGSYFVDLPLVAGSQTLMATLATQEGQISSQTLTVSANPAPFRLSIDGEHSLVSLVVNLSLEGGNGVAYDHINWYCDDNVGLPFVTVASTNPGMSCTYSTEGRYHPHLEVVDAQSNTLYSTASYVQVDDPFYRDAMLTNTYNSMLARLAAGDTATALTAISDGNQDKYSSVFSTLQATLPNIVSQFGALQPGSLSDLMAQYIILQPQNMSTQSNAFEVYFLVGDDGIWRIDGM